jgi:hypothetical protein
MGILTRRCDITPTARDRGLECRHPGNRLVCFNWVCQGSTGLLATHVGIWGAPTRALQYVSICGSVVLFVAGTFAKWKPRVTAFTATGASAAIWCFYAPALIRTLRSLPTSMTMQSTLMVFAPVFLLVLTTAYAVTDIARGYRAARPGPLSHV